MSVVLNAVVGNAGVAWKHGDDVALTSLSEDARITAHLEYALNRLCHLEESPFDQEARNASLQSLSEYIQGGIFPRHEDSTTPLARKPCFIDSRGIPCAVAHIMQTNGHSTLADKIATQHKHSTIEDMVADDNIREELVEWRMQSGLTVDELVLIQPTYQYQFRYESRQARSARRRFLAIIAKMQQLVEELKASAPEGAISYGDVPDAVVKDLEEDIRKFAFTFRNGNISKYYGGAASPYDVIPHWGWTLIESTGIIPRTRRSPMGWTVGDMKDFNKQIDAFEATLPSSGCEQVRMLVGKLRHAASGKRNPEHSLYVDDDSEYEDIEYDCTSGRS